MAEDAAESGSRKGPQKIERPVGEGNADRLFLSRISGATAGRSSLCSRARLSQDGSALGVAEEKSREGEEFS
jgi:hypothetical protein